jgi:hypothetical protein
MTLQTFRITRIIALTVFMLLTSGSFIQSRADEKSADLPARIMIIRHGEKPADDKSVNLSPEGAERANALDNLFKSSTNRPDPFPTPDFIFAASNSKHSHRSLETVTPLAKKLKLTINTTYADEDYAKLAHEILTNKKYAGKTILIAWHHGKIPELATELRAKGVMEHWKGTVFDRVWQITYEKDGKAVFADLPQHLLPGDSNK